MDEKEFRIEEIILDPRNFKPSYDDIGEQQTTVILSGFIPGLR
jgi:hypothetical protein